MKIIEVRYHALFNLGDYENEKIEFAAQVEEGEIPGELIDQLRKRARECAQPSAQKSFDERWKVQRELEDLKKKLIAARAEWEATAEFLKAQGLRVDAPQMPAFTNLLNAAQEEDFSVSEGELI